MTTIYHKKTSLVVADWGLVDYQSAFERQSALVQARLAGEGCDTLILVEHPATVTLGRRATAADLHFSEGAYAERGIALHTINRGGLATAHEPGQLVVYPLVVLKQKDLRWFAHSFLQAVVALLEDYGVEGYLKDGEPGVWVHGCKICSFGIAVKKWISSHGIALNVNNDLDVFSTIVACGRPAEVVTSLKRELGTPVDLAVVKKRFVKYFCAGFDYVTAEEIAI